FAPPESIVAVPGRSGDKSRMTGCNIPLCPPSRSFAKPLRKRRRRESREAKRSGQILSFPAAGIVILRRRNEWADFGSDGGPAERRGSRAGSRRLRARDSGFPASAAVGTTESASKSRLAVELF